MKCFNMIKTGSVEYYLIESAEEYSNEEFVALVRTMIISEGFDVQINVLDNDFDESTNMNLYKIEINRSNHSDRNHSNG